MENKVGSSKIYDNEHDCVSELQGIKKGTIPMDILEFHHSYGYNCQRYFNFCVVDPNTIIFISGCLIHIFDIINRKLKFRCGSTGSGVGHIAKNPLIAHIAVGENGINPPIIIYNWPSFEIVTILYGGTTQFFSHLSYSPDGDLLVSQGGYPDYLITVWNWKKSSIMLRCKSHCQDIHNVMFSSSTYGHMITCGVGHIKFWQITPTFTGLKLKGELGRFGRTEISDIIGVLVMPDGKVVSGCEWGNILLWDEGLIKLEVRRKNEKSCHNKMITQFEYKNGELVSIGMDGWIRFWYYDTIDQADPPDNDRFLGIEPIYEFKIGGDPTKTNDGFLANSMLMNLQKKNPDNPEETLWYAQDGNGGFWLIDLNTLQSQTVTRSQKLFTCHAGAVNDIAACTWGEFIATCGMDGRLNIYNYLKKEIIISHIFRDSGTCVVWFSCKVESTGSTMVCAFRSGILRIITMSIAKTDESQGNKNKYVRLIQVIKPHTKPITNMSVNFTNSLLITCSEDSTIFIFSIKITDKYPLLVPIGFINMPSSVTCMTWKFQYSSSILVGCLHGECVEIDLPDVPQSYTTVSYELTHSTKKVLNLHPEKLKISREIVKVTLQENRTAEKLILHSETEQLKSTNRAVEIHEQLYPISEFPNRVTSINYSKTETIYITLAGGDKGFFYEYLIPKNNLDVIEEPIKCIPVYDAIDKEIHCCLFYDYQYAIMGLEQGEIRVCRLKNEDFTDLSDYCSFHMHDKYTGYIAKIILSYDEKMLFTCGHDGNIFAFIVNGDSSPEHIIREVASPLYSFPKSHIDDIEDADHPNLEEIIRRNEERRVMLEVKERKDHILTILREMSEEYRVISEENSTLLKSQQIPHEELYLDSRIEKDLSDQLKSEMNVVYEKMTFVIEKCRLTLKKLTDQFIKPITCIPFAVTRILEPNRIVHSLRVKMLDQYNTNSCLELLEQLKKNESIKRNELAKRNEIIMKASVEHASSQIENKLKEQKIEDVECFLKNLSSSTIKHKLGTQFTHLLKKYQEQKEKLERKAQEWQLMNSLKPNSNADDDENIDAIDKAKQTIGDYKLKSAMNFNLNDKSMRETTLDIYEQILDCRKKSHYVSVDFNEQLKAIRDEKLKLHDETKELIEKLKSIHMEIPEKYVKPLPEILRINYSIEYPEKNLELEKYMTMPERVENARLIRKSTFDKVKIVPNAEEYEILLIDEKSINNKKSIFPIDLIVCETKIHIPDNVMESLNTNDIVESTWEHEMKLVRMEKKIYEQDKILNYITRSYESIDKSLDELERKRCVIQADSCYSKLYQLTLHQKLITLCDYEQNEDFLTKKVDEKLMARTTLKQQIQRTTTNVNKKKNDIVKLQDEIKELSSQFSSKISEDSSDIDSTSEEDVGSSDSQELELIHLDENICPSDCDEELYNTALSMRSKRYEYECQIRDDSKTIDILKREAEQNAKELKTIENLLSESQRELSAFMIEKQSKLNDIDATVILNLNQFQNFVDNDILTKIRDCVVFDKGQLSLLNTRVGQLQQETIDQIVEHKKTHVHLSRMEIDCKYMDGNVKQLNEEINEEMFNKFGRRIPLTDLYEDVLRLMVIDIRSDIKMMIKIHDKEVTCVKEKYNDQCLILENVIQENTEKLSFLAVLEEEHAKLGKILKQVPESEESMSKIEWDYKKELTELGTILKNQCQQTELFLNEIRNLSSKSHPLPPPYSRVEPNTSHKEIVKLDTKNNSIASTKISTLLFANQE